jgi:dTDP-4-amino-4,6-dideoxygalactose transaminase
MYSAHQITREFEAALCEYTGAPYAVAVNSCTMALLLAVKWHINHKPSHEVIGMGHLIPTDNSIEIPKRTYCSVPMSIIHAGGKPVFRDEEWKGLYQLKPLPVWDSARFLTSGMYDYKHIYELPARDGLGIDKVKILTPLRGSMVCVSFHASKILGDTQGGAILHDNPEADAWFRRARFDGRAEGVAPKDDTFILGHHCYMNPDTAARLLWKLSILPKHNEPLPNDEYADLSLQECFK